MESQVAEVLQELVFMQSKYDHSMFTRITIEGTLLFLCVLMISK